MFHDALMGSMMRKKDIVTPATLGAEIWLSATAIEGANENDNIGTMPDVIDGVDAVQVEAAKQPTYQVIDGVPYLLFDGSNDFMEAPYDYEAKYDLTSEITIGYNMVIASDASDGFVWASYHGGPDFSANMSSGLLRGRHNAGTHGEIDSTPLGKSFFVLHSNDDGAFVIDANGEQIQHDGTTGSLARFASLILGGRYNPSFPAGYRDFAKCYIKDWFLIPRLLTPAEKTTLYANREAY